MDGTSGASCAVHAGQVASGVCSRCGSFVCEQCTGGGGNQCAACRERTGASAFPLGRSNWSFSGVMSYAWEAFQREWLMLSVSALVLLVISAGLGIVGELANGASGKNPVLGLVVSVVTNVVNGLLGMGMIRVVLDVYEGRSADVGRLFSQFGKIGKYIVFGLYLGAVIGLPCAAYAGVVAGIIHLTVGFEASSALTIGALAALPAIPVLIYVTLGLVFAQMELVRDDSVGPVDAVRNSWQLARGVRVEIFGVSLVSGLIVLAGLIALCVGIIPAIALAQLVMVGMYLALRNP
ncbi:MAG: hypothetical protein HY901_05730 [Deltaproteobacteria bacterium]|nr:hypothetical protein [Deltaproteobacteria bacterium]